MLFIYYYHRHTLYAEKNPKDEKLFREKIRKYRIVCKLFTVTIRNSYFDDSVCCEEKCLKSETNNIIFNSLTNYRYFNFS